MQDLFSLWEQNVLFHFNPYKGELATMSDIGDNSMWKADELREAIDTRCNNVREAILSIQEVAVHAVLHVVEHGDTTFGTRIFQKLPNGVKSNDFKNWFEDHAGCEWDKATFKLMKGKPKTTNMIKLSASQWYKYKRDTSNQAYDPAKALRNVAKAFSSEKKSTFVNSDDLNQRSAWQELLDCMGGAGFMVPGYADALAGEFEPEKKAVGF